MFSLIIDEYKLCFRSSKPTLDVTDHSFTFKSFPKSKTCRRKVVRDDRDLKLKLSVALCDNFCKLSGKNKSAITCFSSN